jgi:hypothetical protein
MESDLHDKMGELHKILYNEYSNEYLDEQPEYSEHDDEEQVIDDIMCENTPIRINNNLKI